MWRFLGVKESDGLGEEVFAEPGSSALYATIPLTRQQKGKQSMRRMSGIPSNISGLGQAAFG